MAATPPDFSVIIRAPRDYLGSRYANYYDKTGRETRNKDFTDTWAPPVSTQARFVCLRSPYNTWITDADLEDVTYAKESGSGNGSFVYSYNSFGLSDKGVAQNDTQCAWIIYANTDDELDTCPIAYGRWMPNGTYNAPTIDIYPRMDMDRSFSSGGYTYYFTPFFVRINGFESIQFFEYEADNFVDFDEDNDTMLNKVDEIYFGPSASTSIDSNVYWSVGFIPLGLDGVYVYGNINNYTFGRAYFSKIEREEMPLLPAGKIGVRNKTQGASLVCLGKCVFTSSGTVESQLYSKPESNTDYPTLDSSTYEPEDTSITVTLVTEDGTTISEGDEFQDWKYKATFATTDTSKTPILFDVDIDFDGVLEEYIEDGLDITSYVTDIQENSGMEIGEFSSSIRVKNPSGIMNWILNRVAHELVYTVQGTPRALLYTGDMDVELYRVPGQEAYFATWNCGDGWKKLQDQLCFNMPALDGKTVYDGLTEFFTYLGWNPDNLDIDDIDFTFPEKRGGQDYFVKPEDGQPAAEFLKDLYERFFRRYIMRFDGSGKFQLKSEDDTTVNREFYLGRDDAVVAYGLANEAWGQGELDDPPDPDDFTWFVMGDVEVNYLYSEYKNEVWVMGYDPLCDYINTALWIDLESQFNPYYPNYIGDRKLIFLLTNIANQGIIDYICEQIAVWYGTPRLRIKFKSKFDPALRAGDFITIFPHPSIFRIEGLEIDVSDGNVDYSEGNIYGMNITAISWPLAYDEAFSEDVE